MANIANVKVKAGNVLELSGSSVSISGSQGLNLHTQNGGISADAGSGPISLSSSAGTITLSATQLQLTGSAALKGDLSVSGTITAHTLNIVETTVTTLAKEGSTKFGNDSSDNHQFSGSVLLSGSMSIAAGSGQYNGSGAGLTNIPNGALSNSTIGINGTSVSLGGSITTVGAGNGLAEATASGKVTLSVKLSGSDSGLVVDDGGVKLSGSVARLDRDANFGTYAVTASVLSGSEVSASVGVSGALGQFGSLTLGTALSLGNGGTGADLSAASEGKNNFVMARSGSQLAAFELTSSTNTVTISGNGTTKKIDLSVNVGAAGGVTLNTVQTITAQKTFTGGLIVSGSGTSLTIATAGGIFIEDHPQLLLSGSASFGGPAVFSHKVITGVRSVSATTVLSANDHTILVSGAGDKKIELAASDLGRQLVVKKTDANTDRLYLSGSGCTIDGQDEYDLYGPFQSVNLVFSGSNWYVL